MDLLKECRPSTGDNLIHLFTICAASSPRRKTPKLHIRRVCVVLVTVHLVHMVTSQEMGMYSHVSCLKCSLKLLCDVSLVLCVCVCVCLCEIAFTSRGIDTEERPLSLACEGVSGWRCCWWWGVVSASFKQLALPLQLPPCTGTLVLSLSPSSSHTHFCIWKSWPNAPLLKNNSIEW